MLEMKVGGKFAVIIQAALIVLALPILSGCAGGQARTIQGIIQEIDLTKGAMAIRVDKGENVNLLLNTATEIQINGRQVDVTYLEPGLSTKVQAKGKSADLIEVDLAQLDATIVKVDNNQLTLQPLSSSQQLTLKVKPFSIVHQNDADASLKDLSSGRVAEVYFCTASGTVYEVNEMPEGYAVEEEPDGSRLEGVVTRFRLNQLNVTAIGGLERGIWLDENTKIVFQDGTPATKEDIVYWDWVTVYYNPSTVVANQVKIRPDSRIREYGSLNQYSPDGQ
jgi:hypothetical protein